jgi:hypothetical protein
MSQEFIASFTAIRATRGTWMIRAIDMAFGLPKRVQVKGA